MAYKVFLSHSTRDTGLVTSLTHILHKFGINVYVAEWFLKPGQRLDGVLKEIDKADCVVVLLTHNGIRSKWVHQEIGYAKRAEKPVIPLVEKGITSTELASLEGRKYIEYDPLQPQKAILKMSSYVKSLKLKKEEQEKALLVVGGLLAFLLLLSGGEK